VGVNNVVPQRWIGVIVVTIVIGSFVFADFAGPLAGVTLAAVLIVLLDKVERQFRRAIPRPSASPICGYNLTGNVSGTCPECGTSFEIYACSGPGVHTWEIRALSMPPQNQDISN
jgi:hypothetical protein